jgi:putative methyltransferase (TIGR04325 family)
MNSGHLIKRLLPPFVTDWIRRARSGTHPSFTWEGVYPRLGDVPTENGKYDEAAQVEYFLSQTREKLALVREGKTPDPGRHGPLAWLVASVSANQNPVRLLDFGGGVGQGFVQLLGNLRGGATIEYHVVELEGMCIAGRQFFAGDSRIRFHTTLPPMHNGLDIVYASSVLSYVENYADLLQQLAGYRARYLLLTQLAAGPFPTYATRQLNLPGQVLAYWFLNLEEVKTIITGLGYSLAYEDQSGPEHDQRNFPETHRLGRMRNLLFFRSEEPK